ncbi:MAG: hypothetical protein H7175_14440 [Burkholderiales bacterium]|nr:hypothetical protein [Anaerolineae bacterium]
MLPNWFSRYSPFAAVSSDNPLFRVESRQVKRGTTVALWHSSIKVAAITLLLMLGLWAWSLLSIYSSTSGLLNAPYGSAYDDSDLLTLVAWLAGLGFCDKLILDFFGMWVGLHSFNADVTSKRWDVLRLTPIKAETIIDSRIALAQIQAWRPFVFVVAFRFGVLLLGIVTLLVPPLLFPQWRGSMQDVRDQLLRDPVTIIGPLFIAFTFSAFYLIEPYWRMRMVTASSVAVAAKMRSLPMSVLYGLWHIVIVWFFQIIIAVASLILMNILFNRTSSSPLLDYILVVVWVGAVTVITYFIYRSRARVWHAQARQAIAAELINLPEFR